MKFQTIKKIFAFITSMMFSVYFLQAQTCPGNKVLLYSGGSRYTSKCVNTSKVNNYLSTGWHYYPCYSGGIGQHFNKAQDSNRWHKFLAIVPVDIALVSKKVTKK